MNQPRLAERAILMRMSAGLPGKNRKDKTLTQDVKSEHGLGEKSGGWIKQRWPDWALEPLEKLITKASTYHRAVTLPFDNGIGVLPAALIYEYQERMREFAGQFTNLRDSHFKPNYPEMIEWAKKEHNGTFDESDYPPVEELMEDFYLQTQPLPVPDAGHFQATIAELLGQDAHSVDVRIADAMQEAQRELMKRIIAPVKTMVAQLADQKEGERRRKIYDTVVSNIQDIAKLAPKLNLSGDPKIDDFVKEINKLTLYDADVLRSSERTRSDVRQQAADTLKKLEAYAI